MTENAMTVRSIFFNGPAAAAGALTTAAKTGEAGEAVGGALGRMPDAARSAVFARVGEVAAGMLDLDVTDIVGQAWGKHSALRRAAAATLAAPDTEQLIEMVTHSMTFKHRPSVEIHVADLPVTTIELVAQLEITVHGMLAVVRGGRLTAIRAGTADLAGTLSFAGQQVAQRQVSLALPVVLRLRNGLALLDEPAATSA